MLELQGVTLRYGTATALDAIDLDARPGETVAVMGPSGSGKTSLLRVVAGLDDPDEGSVCWDGADITALPPHERGFGLMFQDYALFPHKSVAGNVAFGLRMRGLSNDAVAAQVRDALDLVGLGGYESRSVGTLSGGEQQRVALARTLAPSPKMVMLDEPIGALDRNLRERLLEEMRRIFAQIDAGVLYVTHDRDEAFAVADRVAVMQLGRLIRAGTPETVWSDPQSEFTARFLGWARLPAPTSAPVSGVAIPPTGLRLDESAGTTGRVSAVRFSGRGYRVTVTLDDGTDLAVDSPSDRVIGSGVAVAIDPKAVAFLES